ncbi:hypothetical protein ABTN38_19785, partial [Acinetobacter baumannii]
DSRLGQGDALMDFTVPAGDGRTLAWLYEHADVVHRAMNGDGDTDIRLRVPAERRERVIAHLRKAGIAV